jgi:hypothetical protein
MKKQLTLGDIYGSMLKNVKVVSESAQENINKSNKKIKMSKNAFSDKNSPIKGGPTSADGFHKALNDDYCGCEEDEERFDRKYKRANELEEQLKNPNLPEKKKKGLQNALKKLQADMQREEAEENIVKESKKIARERLNTFMMKKSTFDKLFESVMGGNFDQQEDAQEVDALGLGDAPTDDEFGDDEFGDEGDDQVTLTIDRAVAQQLMDLLQAAVGGGEEDFGDEGDDLDFEGEDDFGGDGEDDLDMDEEEGDEYYEEDEESTFPTDKVGNDGTVGAKDGKGGGQQHKLQGKSNKVGGRPQPKNQKTKVVGTTDKVGNDGDYGHAIHSGKQPDMGKQNKVSDLRPAEDYFR